MPILQIESHRKINWDNLDKNLYQKLVDTALKQLDTHNLGLESKMKASTDILVMMAKIASPKTINTSHIKYKESKEKRNIKRAISTVTKKIKKRVEPSQKQAKKTKTIKTTIKDTNK